GQRIQRQHQCGRVVVDRECRLGAGQSDQPTRNVVVALAAPATLDVVFERGRVTHRRGRGGDRLLRQRRAAEIGVQHGAGQIEDAALRWLHGPGERSVFFFCYGGHRGGGTTTAPFI